MQTSQGEGKDRVERVMEMRRKASVWKEEGEKSTSKSHKHKPLLKAVERATSQFCSQCQQAEGK